MEGLSLNKTSDLQNGLPDETALSAGLFGKYAYFSGENNSESYEYIRVSDDSVLKALQGEGTISAWLFRDVEEQDESLGDSSHMLRCSHAQVELHTSHILHLQTWNHSCKVYTFLCSHQDSGRRDK